MRPRLVSAAEVVDEVARIADRFPARTVFVGIDGFGGTGKSTLAERIAAALPRVVVVHVDDLSGPRLATWDWRRFRAQVLAPLLAARPAHFQRWDWDRDEGAEWLDVAVGSVVVVEGVSSTRADVDAPWDLTIWVDAPREIRLARAVERDGAAMLPRWLEDWMPSEEAYAEQEKPQERVDLIVSGAPAPLGSPTREPDSGDTGEDVRG